MHTERVQARASAAARKSNHRFRCDRLILVVVSVIGASLALADPPAKTMLFNIEAQPARTSLTLYAKQAQVQLGFAADVVDDILTNAVKGEYDSVEALELLLEGTGLEAEQGTSGIIIRRVPTQKLPRHIEGAASPLAGAGGLQLAQAAAQAKPQTRASTMDNRDEEPAVKRRDQIVVTGSRIRGAQIASPVVTITRGEIDQAGFATVEELVDKLPQNFGAGASLDTHTNFVNTRNIVGGRVDDRAGGTSVNLRGLGASSTLILLNGQRMSPSGLSARFTNVSSIPVTAIERVEILTDGASAIYGSDAIGGVVNFILRDNYEGAETRLRYGVARGGVKPEVLLGQSFGTSWDKGNALLTYEYYNSDNLASSDRDITSTNDLSRFGGTDWRTPGGNPANIVAGGQTFAIPAGQDGTALTAADFDPNVPPNLFNSRALSDLIPEQERHSAFLHVTQSIGKAELFAQAQYSSQDSLIRGSAGSLDITVTDANPFFVDPTGTGLTTVRVDNYVFDKDLGPSEDFGEIDSIGTAVGVRRDITESWEIELTGNWAKEEAKAGDGTILNVAEIEAAANQMDTDLAFNPFGGGSSSTNPSVLESFVDRTRSLDSVSENTLWGISLGVEGKLLDLPGGAMHLATGIEFREESLSSTDLVLGIISDTGRNVSAAYAEIFFPLVGSPNSRPGLRRFELSLAGRYEDYSDFGSSTNPKMSILWSPTQSLMLRGTYGTAFRAPAMYDLNVSDPNANFISYFPQFIADLVGFRFPVIVRLGNNEGLTAEEATTWTAGFQWSPERINGLLLDLTYFNVDFEDRIDFPGSDLLAGVNDPRYAPLRTLNPTLEQIAALVNDPRWVEDDFGDFEADLLSGTAPVGAVLDFRKTNLAQSVVTGMDLQLSYNFETALGSFALGLNGSYMFDFERRLLAADPLADEVDRLGRPIDFRARGNVTWSSREWSVSGYANYADGYTDNVSDPARRVDSWTTVDLTIAYDVGDTDSFLSDTRLSVTAHNLFNEAPPFVNTIGGVGYDATNGNAVGRFLALQVTKEW